MRSEQIPNHDPFTIEIIQNSLHAICDEMFAATRKTAMSSIIYEVQDLGVGVMDADGNLTTQGAGLPIFIGMLDASAKQVLKKFGPSNEIFPGDVYITNDPYSGGVSHLNDVVLVMPVFADDRLIGWTANKAHWSDIGGMVHGSISTDADEVFQEGLQLPDIKLIERDRPIQSVFDLITANVRVPDYALGDLWAAIASIRAGERRLIEMAQKYGLGAVEHAMAQLLDYGEKVSRRAVSALPDGVYTAEDRTDDGLTMRVKVTIQDGDFVVDLRDNPDRVAGPYNCPYACTVVGARILFKALTGPHSVTNEGCFRPLTVLTDKGSMFDVERPVAVGMYFDPMMYTIDLIWKAMAPIAPERLGAGHLQSALAVIFAMNHPDTGKFIVTIEPEVGGWGAAPGHDGESAQFCAGGGETYNCPIEINEVRNGLFVDQYAFHTQAGGEGEYRGGRGVVLDYRIRADGTRLTGLFARTNGNPPFGLNGGRDGSLNRLSILRRDGTEETHSRVAALELDRGDVVRITTAHGGGYGDPLRRSREKVVEDLRDELITREQAASHYGFADP